LKRNFALTQQNDVLPAAQDHPHAQHNRAEDEQDAHELQARRIIGPSGHQPPMPIAMARMTTK
jgi:hypothetical protein